MYHIETRISIDKYTKQMNDYRTEIEQYQQQLKYEQRTFGNS
jgi:predicted ATP-grasp superfamily ATP-dependent carboligase